ncbi:COP9 signalosome complex subunit 5 [Leucosporidium creatinivorum]|uniref:COP9 signalosome complex subunit 5 n=1 Tax=Leucosporidium creatinivorum TaxID=106004 RepID=A0A1Y2C474_9BASI|nr:COP9 signalosome complex subunit 5 [Leucosporidium creatinivorum]
MEATARANFDLANNIQEVDQLFRYDKAAQQAITNARPWRTDPGHFKKVRISAVALIKMVMHARSGGQYEIMGLMQGQLDGDTFIVNDCFPLPVIGTETRVNAQEGANEFMIQFLENSPQVGRLENVVGWYHSHPGYGCWLSGIDVATQKTNQMFQDPFLAVVIDPNRTISAGRVEIGAFRTYPDNYTPPNATPSEYQSIPSNKIEDFGVHANSYYPLEISHFKSTNDAKLLDLLWNKYWVTTLSQSPLVSNRAYMTSQIGDLVEKIGKTEQSVQHRCGIGAMAPIIAAARAAKNKSAGGDKKDDNEVKNEETALAKAVKDSTKVSVEASHGLIGALLKDSLFNGGRLAKEEETPMDSTFPRHQPPALLLSVLPFLSAFE